MPKKPSLEEDDDLEEEEEEEEEEEDDEEETEEEAEEEEETPSAAKSQWLFTGEQAETQKKKYFSTLKSSFRPVMWGVKLGQTKKIRFLSRKPVGCLFMHSIKGPKYWDQYTCCGKNCQFCLADSRKSYVYLYLVHEFGDYTDRKGKKHSVSAKYLQLTDTRHKVIQKMADKLKAKGSDLRKYIIEVSREGEGPSTTYNYWPEEQKPMSDEEKGLPDLSTKESLDKFYKPLSTEEQKKIVSRFSRTAEMEE